MPNQVHVVVTPSTDHQLSRILQSWKSFTAKIFNRTLGRGGAFWQKESFDHIVRSPEALERIAVYIRQNPAGLATGTYSLSTFVQTRQDAASTLEARQADEGTRQRT
jgi:hypothetical protein